MAETLTDTVQQAIEQFDVDPELCIACDACCQDFPEIFFMGDDAKAHAHPDHNEELYNARTVIDVCPTAAINFSGEVPEAEDLANLEEVPGWEKEWALWRGAEEDLVERDRRYGRDYQVEEHDGYIQITMQYPTKVPAVRDRFRYGMEETMPLYGTHVTLEGDTVAVYGWVKDPKVRALTHTSSSFPGQFRADFEMKKPIYGMQQRYDAHHRMRVVLFTEPEKAKTFQWQAHFITDKCTACTICERVCPTNAITGGERFYIDPDLCINCSVCGTYCPFDAIDDDREEVCTYVKPKQVPKAVVHEELCTGCEFCVDVCPFDALSMKRLEPEDGYPLPQTSTVALVFEKNCTSCKLCEQVCIKDAIEVPREHTFQDIGMSFQNYLVDDH